MGLGGGVDLCLLAFFPLHFIVYFTPHIGSDISFFFRFQFLFFLLFCLSAYGPAGTSPSLFLCFLAGRDNLLFIFPGLDFSEE